MAYREQRSYGASSSARAILDAPEFSGEAFLALPQDERVLYCTRVAERAHNRAKGSPEPYKRFYLEIAQQWLLLAEAILQNRKGLLR